MSSAKRPWPFLRPVLMIALFAIALRVALTLAGYLMMTGYDTLAFRYIRHPLPYRKIALASFIGYAFNNNVGLSGLVGGSLRYRLYNAWRLSAVEIAKVIAFYTITFWLGFVLLGGSLFIFAPPQVPASVHLPFNSIRILGFVLLLPAIAYLTWAIVRRQPVRIRQWEFELPAPRLMIAQVLISGADWMIAAAVLYI